MTKRGVFTQLKEWVKKAFVCGNCLKLSLSLSFTISLRTFYSICASFRATLEQINPVRNLLGDDTAALFILPPSSPLDKWKSRPSGPSLSYIVQKCKSTCSSSPRFSVAFSFLCALTPSCCAKTRSTQVIMCSQPSIIIFISRQGAPNVFK